MPFSIKQKIGEKITLTTSIGWQIGIVFFPLYLFTPKENENNV